MTIGPNEDGAELYRLHLESLVCPKCGGCKEDRDLHIHQLHEFCAVKDARLALLEKVAAIAKKVDRKFFSPVNPNYPINEEMGELHDALKALR